MSFPVFLYLLRSSSIKYPVCYILVSSFLDPRVNRDRIIHHTRWSSPASAAHRARRLREVCRCPRLARARHRSRKRKPAGVSAWLLPAHLFRRWSCPARLRLHWFRPVPRYHRAPPGTPGFVSSFWGDGLEPRPRACSSPALSNACSSPSPSSACSSPAPSGACSSPTPSGACSSPAPSVPESQSRPSAYESQSRPSAYESQSCPSAYESQRFQSTPEARLLRFLSAPETQHYPNAHVSQRFQSAPKSWSCPAHLCLCWSRPAHLCLRWSRPAHLCLRWSCPAHLCLRWSRPAHLGPRWSLFYCTFLLFIVSSYLHFLPIYILLCCYFFCTVYWADLTWFTFHYWLYPV